MTRNTHLIAYLKTLADEVDSKLMSKITILDDQCGVCIEDLVWVRKALLSLAQSLEVGDRSSALQAGSKPVPRMISGGAV